MPWKIREMIQRTIQVPYSVDSDNRGTSGGENPSINMPGQSLLSDIINIRIENGNWPP